MIKITFHCPFAGTHSPKPGTTVEAVKLVALQEKDGPNAQHFADGIGSGTCDLTKITAAVRNQFQAGKVYELTFKEVELKPVS